MPGRLPKAQNTTSICIFCATRLQAHRAFSVSARRYLHSSQSRGIPANSAVATAEPEDEKDVGWAVRPMPAARPRQPFGRLGEPWNQSDRSFDATQEQREVNNTLRIRPHRETKVFDNGTTTPGGNVKPSVRVKETVTSPAALDSTTRSLTTGAASEMDTKKGTRRNGIWRPALRDSGAAQGNPDSTRSHKPSSRGGFRIRYFDARERDPPLQQRNREDGGRAVRHSMIPTPPTPQKDPTQEEMDEKRRQWKHIRPLDDSSSATASEFASELTQGNASSQDVHSRRMLKYSATSFDGFDQIIRDNSGSLAAFEPSDRSVISESIQRDERTARLSFNAPMVVDHQFRERPEEQVNTRARRPRQAERQAAERAQRKASRFRRDDYNDDVDDSLATRIERKRARKKERLNRKAQAAPTPVLLPEFISIANLANALRVRAEEFAGKLSELGFEDMKNDHVIDAETAGLIASEFNFEPILPEASAEEDIVALPPPEDKSLLIPRPPVITIMGHVDHGKTTLLDWLRKSSVAANEHGGITQHIGAFTVSMPSGRVITFLDTPGHAAFLSMRERGANVTDIVILVVAADDSVKPQTIEAIKHAHTARVPMIVAINKIDKEDANPERVKQDLARHGVNVEDFGGDTQTVCVSGRTGHGMEQLEETVIALADVLDVRAPETGPVEGWVLEATAKKAGKVATVLIRRGTLTRGTILVAGTTWTRVRTMKNEGGSSVESAGPGVPVEIDGWREQPIAGDEILQAPDEQRARRAIEFRLEKLESSRLVSDVAAVNEAREARAIEAANEAETEDGKVAANAAVSRGPAELPIIIRGDVSGSVEAISDSILGLGNGEVRPKILRAVVGPMSPSDIEYAATAGGIIVCFNLPRDGDLFNTAGQSGVKIIEGSIIYRVMDDIKSKLEELLPEKVEQRVLGEAEIVTPFEIGIGGRRKVKIAGSKVKNGNVLKGGRVRITRAGEVIYDGTISSLKSHKKDVPEIRKGSECGIGFEEFVDFEAGDQIQHYEEVRSKRTL